MYIEGPPPLYISYVSQEQTKQDQYQETLDAAGDKRPVNQKGNKSE